MRVCFCRLRKIFLRSEESDSDSPEDEVNLQALKKVLFDAQDVLQGEVTRLTAATLRQSAGHSTATTVQESTPQAGLRPVHHRKGKAPPADSFSGDDPTLPFEDWLPGLQWAVVWYAWTEAEHLLQLAGYLRGRALQEWNLLDSHDKVTLDSMVASLKVRLDPGNKLVASQGFCHLSEKDGASVAKFISRLETLFKVAYGKDDMGK